METLKVAVVGGGFISSNRHLPAWRSLGKKVELVGLSDLNREMALKVGEQFRIKHVYSDAAEMIVKEKPDVVDICTPPATHAKLALLAMENVTLTAHAAFMTQEATMRMLRTAIDLAVAAGA